MFGGWTEVSNLLLFLYLNLVGFYASTPVFHILEADYLKYYESLYMMLMMMIF